MANPQINPEHLKEVALVLKDMPLAGTCALLVIFITAMAGYILLLHRANNKLQKENTVAEKEDHEAKYMMGEALVRLSSRIGRLIASAQARGDDVPEDVEDDDKTMLMADILKGLKKVKERGKLK